MFFFENRVKWEAEAHAKEKLYEELDLLRRDAALTESEYQEQLFDIVMKRNRDVNVANG